MHVLTASKKKNLVYGLPLKFISSKGDNINWLTVKILANKWDPVAVTYYLGRDFLI